MKGVILAGGTGSRLHPLTLVTNKHLLPIYNKPMIYYPIETLIKGGIKDIMIVCGPEHAGDFMNLLRSGKEFGARFTYEIQDTASGIAGALSLAREFAGGDDLTVILGDNVIEETFDLTNFDGGAKVFLKIVADPKRYGIAQIEDNIIVSVEENPENPKSNYAIIGLYQYDKGVFEMIDKINPSERGELEITDVNNEYLKNNELRYAIVRGLWCDAGTTESLHYASTMVKKMDIK